MNHPRSRPVRLFLDANVLISAAWKKDSKVNRIWRIPNLDLVTSDYVLNECRRNLRTADRTDRLYRLLDGVRVLEFEKTPVLQDPPPLPEKDQPVLAAALLSRAHYLVTGDRKHFGLWYGKSLQGIRVEPPGNFPEVLHRTELSDP